jgi:hypothetical protein
MARNFVPNRGRMRAWHPGRRHFVRPAPRLPRAVAPDFITIRRHPDHIHATGAGPGKERKMNDPWTKESRLPCAQHEHFVNGVEVPCRNTRT